MQTRLKKIQTALSSESVSCFSFPVDTHPLWADNFGLKDASRNRPPHLFVAAIRAVRRAHPKQGAASLEPVFRTRQPINRGLFISAVLPSQSPALFRLTADALDPISNHSFILFIFRNLPVSPHSKA